MEETIAVLGVIFIGILLVKIIHFVYRMKMVYLAADLSREIQGIETLPKPPLRNLVNLVVFLLEKQKEIGVKIKEDDKDDKYRNMYR